MAASHGSRPVAAQPLTAARVSCAAVTVFSGLLAALHLTRPDLDPSWRFISEYAIGPHGWVMQLAFLSWASSYVALFVALRPHVGSIAGRVGLALLLTSAGGLAIAAVFTTDPITTPPDGATLSGTLHNLGGTLGISMPVAAVLVSWSLSRNPAWASLRRPLLYAAALASSGFLVALVSMGVMLARTGGAFGPEAPVGWPNRLEVLGYCVWLIVTAWCAIQAGRGTRLQARTEPARSARRAASP